MLNNFVCALLEWIEQLIIFLLRSGHNRLNASRRWLDEERSPSCRICEAAEEDVNHINLEQYRIKFKEVCLKTIVNFVTSYVCLRIEQA